MTNKIEVIPAILEKSPRELLEKIKILDGVSEIIQIDFADGVFVKNKTFLPDQLRSLPQDFQYVFHLMVENPERFKEDIEKLSPETIIFHLEALKDPKQTLSFFRGTSKLGIAINPKTSLDGLMELKNNLDEILIMTVEAGFAGQSFINDSIKKIEQTKKIFPEIKISVDGGINLKNIQSVIKGGADRIYVSSFVFKYGKVKLNYQKLLRQVSC